MNYIVGLLNPLPDGEQYVWLDKLIEAVQKQPLTTSLISKDVIVNAAKVSPRIFGFVQNNFLVVNLFANAICFIFDYIRNVVKGIWKTKMNCWHL